MTWKKVKVRKITRKPNYGLVFGGLILILIGILTLIELHDIHIVIQDDGNGTVAIFFSGVICFSLGLAGLLTGLLFGEESEDYEIKEVEVLK